MKPRTTMISRIGRVLEAFDTAVELSASEIARTTAIPLPSAHRILQEMVRVGFLEQNLESKGYRLGLRLWELARSKSTHFELRDLALPFLQPLPSEFQCIVQLGVLQDAGVVYLEQLGDPLAVPNVTYVGSKLPAVASSSGLVMAAFAERQQMQNILDSKKIKYTSHTVTDKEKLLQIINRARRERYVQLDGWLHPKTTGISVVYKPPTDEVLASVSVLIPIESNRKEELKQRLRKVVADMMKKADERNKQPNDASLEILKLHLKKSSISSFQG